MGETVLLYSAAAVLSAIVAALGFTVLDNGKSGNSISKMVDDLSKAAIPGVKLIVGTAAMGLNPGLFYAYVQVVNGKTSVPQQLIAWVQEWLSANSAYDESTSEYTAKKLPNDYTVGTKIQGNILTLNQLMSDEELLNKSPTLKALSTAGASKAKEFINRMGNYPASFRNDPAAYVYIFDKSENFNSTVSAVNNNNYLIGFDTPKKNIASIFIWSSYNVTTYYNTDYDASGDMVSKGDLEWNNSTAPTQVVYGDVTVVSNPSGFEAGENVPGKDVVIPGEGTGDITNDDIVGWLKSAVGAAVASALGIGTDTLQYVPVGIKNPAMTGDITGALDNVKDQTQDVAQEGATDTDTVATGEKYADLSLAPSKPSGNISASALYTIWNPTQSQLNSLASFLWSTDFVDTIKKILQSPMDALISLALFPVTPPTDGVHNISLGYVDSGVSANRVSDQFMSVQSTGLTVPHKYNSYLDYAPYTNAEIFLPFIGYQPLNINDIMGKVVTITYNIDLLSGICTAIIKVNGQSMYTYSGNMAMFLPLSAGNWANMLTPIFGMVGGVVSMGAGIGGVMSGAGLVQSTGLAVSGARTLGGLEGNSVSRSGSISGNAGIMGDYQPFIVVTRPINDKPATYNNNLGQPYNKSARIGDLSGFTVIEEAHIEGMSATDAEKQEIERLLKEGVIL